MQNQSDYPTGGARGSKLAPGLHLVATPIGNLGDMTARAAEALAGADLVACEDTRVTGSLLGKLGLRAARLTPYHDHNAEKARPALLDRLAAGAAVVLVSDAGMPLVSDPGYKLVRECHEAGIAVRVVPGPSAVLAALAVSGLPTDRFLFAGFPPQKAGKRAAWAAELAGIPATLVLFEGPSRLAATLDALAEALGDREAAVCRELTKLHEEVRRGPLRTLAAGYVQEGPPRGELVVVVGPPNAENGPTAEQMAESLERRLSALLDGGASVREAVAQVTAETGQPRRTVYRAALALAGDRDG